MTHIDKLRELAAKGLRAALDALEKMDGQHQQEKTG